MIVKEVAIPIVALDFVIVEAGIFAVNETVDVPTSAEPLNVVMVTVPVLESLFAATYCARDVGTVQLTEVEEVFVVMVPEPDPNTYVRVCVRFAEARVMVKLRDLPIVLSLAVVVAVDGGICARNVHVDSPIFEPPEYVSQIIVPDERILPDGTSDARVVGTVQE